MKPAARPHGGKRGLFITLEGGEGSGKTTQARLLHEHLSGRGWDVLLTREPGGTLIGEKVRKILLSSESAGMDALTELLLYLAARREHVSSVIRPALSAGTTVIADRFSDATAAYQGYGRGLGLGLIGRLDRLVLEGLSPDVTFLVDLGSAEAGLLRASRRDAASAAGEGRFEEEGREFHRLVRRGYLLQARRHPERITVIPGEGTVEEIHGKVLDILRRRFPARFKPR